MKKKRPSEAVTLALYLAGEDRILKNMDTALRKKTVSMKHEKENAVDVHTSQPFRHLQCVPAGAVYVALTIFVTARQQDTRP